MFQQEEDVTPLALNFDFGLLTLARPAPDGTTYLNIQPGSGSSVQYNLTTAGYPADKPAQTMWQVTSIEHHRYPLSACSPLCSGLRVWAKRCLPAGRLRKCRV